MYAVMVVGNATGASEIKETASSAAQASKQAHTHANTQPWSWNNHVVWRERIVCVCEGDGVVYCLIFDRKAVERVNYRPYTTCQSLSSVCILWSHHHIAQPCQVTPNTTNLLIYIFVGTHRFYCDISMRQTYIKDGLGNNENYCRLICKLR